MPSIEAKLTQWEKEHETKKAKTFVKEDLGKFFTC